MSNLDQVLNQMHDCGLPGLPSGHPVLDGKVHRFGPKKKAWYLLREVDLKSGARVIGGAFGIWQGDNNNAVTVRMDWSGISPEERAQAERKQREFEAREAEKRARLAGNAANRARMQWDSALQEVPSPYLERKQVTREGVRFFSDGTVLVPAMLYSEHGARLVGLQKIAPDGDKRFNSGMAKAGAACLLGQLTDETRLLIIGEGYATARSSRMAIGEAWPAMVAFDAGNLLQVAKGVRTMFPRLHILFAADDDWMLEQRFRARLAEDFKVMDETVAIDGVDRRIVNADGETVDIRAEWRKDACGIDYIEADIRCGRQVRNLKFENAGIARASAAAREVGNASVVWPRFNERGQNKWTDFNDLHVEQSLDDVAAQLSTAVENALAIPPGPSLGEAMDATAGTDSPAPSEGNAQPEGANVVQIRPPLEWALDHCALVQGSTDVWDSLNKLRMKRAAFVTMVGKVVAKQWDEHAHRRSISPRNLPKLVRGVAVPEGARGDDGLVGMLDRYTFLYGTKTVWDGEKRIIINYDALALARGGDLTARWLEHPLHREIDHDCLVFDPTQRVDLNTHINMFEGFPLKPKKDESKAELVLNLLWSLCASEENGRDVFKWVLCWLAYPLQHPGAKMQTALLFFGEKQGTGKSLFFEGIVKPIYGAHGATGGQHQLDATYTMWRSQKLFVLFEEILSRQDKYSHFGLIKHMITGRDTPITQKFKDDRTEANHTNFVMLSNEFQAVPLEPEDRRFLVVDVRTPLDDRLLAGIKAALDDGLIEAFYAFLLEYPLGDFTPYTKPVMTPSKQRVINFGRPDWEAFYLAWSGEELEAPYCSCLATDLHVVYSRYCSKYGFRSLSLTKFSELIAQRVHKDRQWVTLGAASKKQLLTVFHVPYVPKKEGDEPPSLSKQVDSFRTLANIKDAA